MFAGHVVCVEELSGVGYLMARSGCTRHHPQTVAITCVCSVEKDMKGAETYQHIGGAAYQCQSRDILHYYGMAWD